MLKYLPLLFAAIPTFAAGLLTNPEFDKPIETETRFDAAAGCLGRSQFTEDLTWNKCLKLDVAKYVTEKDGKSKYYGLILFGGDQKTPGFPVKPNTVYKFTIEMKGTVPGGNVSFRAFELTGSDFWKDRKALKVKGVDKFTPSDKWAVYTGTFQTGADAKTAMFGIGLWGEERYNNLPPLKSFLLLDKLKAEEMANLLQPGSALVAEVAPRRVLSAGVTGSAFTDYQKGSPAQADTSVKPTFTDKSVILDIVCKEPKMDQLKAAVATDNANPWQDDAVEIFFDPVTSERAVTQLVIAAGGGKWMGFGGPAQPALLKDWTAEVKRGTDAWTIRAEIPYAVLGWEKRPEPGSAIGFNLARQRKAVRELSSWSPVRGSFQDRSKFGVLVIGTPEEWKKSAVSELSAEFAKIPASTQKEALQKEFDAWRAAAVATPEQAVAAAAQWRQRIRQAKLGNRPFAVVAVSPTLDPTIPVLPEELANPPEALKVCAAVNDDRPLPLAVTNLTGEAEEYRVAVGHLGKNGADLPGLRREDGKLFPAEKIRLLRGIRVKDGDGARHGRRFDPLAEMDVTGTMLVPPKESGLVWAMFDTEGVEPGVYRGVLRVIPLCAAGELNRETFQYSGPMLDLPLELEVMPFELANAPAIPQFLFRQPLNEAFFKAMVDSGIEQFLINPWSIEAQFNPDGSLKSSNTAHADAQIADLKKWADKYGIADRMQLGVVYGAYIIYRDVWAKKQFKFGTPEWERGWREYVKLFDSMMKKHGFSSKNYFVEIWDEPHTKDVPELAAACRIARETVPDLRQMVVFAAWAIPPQELAKMAGDIQIWNFWSDRFIGNPEYAPFIESLRKQGKEIAFYSCEVSMRLDLQKYYRRHAWFGLANNLDLIAMYHWIDGPNGDYGLSSWKASNYGGVAYRAGNSPVSSIRLENLKLGNNDLKYMKALELAVAEAKQNGGDAATIAEAETFLRETPQKVGVTLAHDSKQPELARAKASALILKLKQGK